ncbi:MAG: hypothetical protein AAF471_09365, partial [Myxococcota bacterium]
MPGILFSFFSFFGLRLLDPHDVRHPKREAKEVRTKKQDPTDKGEELGFLHKTQQREVYGIFAGFVFLIYIMPIFFPNTWRLAAGPQELWVRGTAGVLGVAMLFAYDLPALVQRYVGIRMLWRVARGFCIPFGCTFMLLQTHYDSSWQLFLATGMLTVMFGQPGAAALSALTLTAIGIPAAVVTHGALAGWDELSATLLETPPELLAILTVGCALQVRLASSEIRLLLQRLTILAATHGKPLHEMSTPIQSLATRARRIEESWPILSDAYRKAKQAGLAVGHIPLDILAIQDIRVPQLSRNMRQVTLMLKMFRDNMRGKPANLDMKVHSLKRVAEEFLYNFPFLHGEEDMARVECEQDYEAELDEAVTWQVLGNLLHNARHFVREKKRGKIIIKVVRD